VEFPSPFSDFLAVLSFLQLDFLTLDCISGENSFYNKVYVTMFFPFLLLAMIVVISVLRVLVSRGRAHVLKNIFKQAIYMALLLSYIGEYNDRRVYM
jgi:Ca2+/H+ antiporter